MKTYKKSIVIASLAISTMLITSCNNDKSNETKSFTPVANFSGKIASDWMGIVRKLVKKESKNPPQASRIYGYNGVALYESLISGMPENKSLAGQINGYTQQTPVLNQEVDYPTVANEVLHKINISLFGTTLSTESVTRLDSIYNANLNERNAISGTLKTNFSVEYGQNIAATLIEYINQDHFAETRSMVYTVPPRITDPHCWAPTNPSITMPSEPFWGQIRTIGLVSPDMSVPSEIPFSSVVGSPFYNQAMEVYTISQGLTSAQKDIAKWWADGPGVTATPPGHWVAIENQLTIDLRLNLQEAAEMYAMVGIAITDAFISCWYTKYQYNLLRPQTYIRDYIAGGESWTSFLGTPSFPEYPSGHSVCSGATSKILTSIFGSLSFVDKTNVNLGLSPRYYSSFYAAADEAAISRIYGGIHFREASEKGVLQGKMLAEYLMLNIELKK
ncbi:vanadium-dependent haloperoxidase [Flavobacterium sp.]|uniref:vanadium-dependent haloperoxidase n=1 Tax=Flavobacterium sp. TaxID=239 RepID=UPI0025FF83B1|nr:vanadium-dependent haloperoxidase [Flavobacterium sp.]